MSGEAIKNALEDVTPDRLRYEADAMFAAVQGEQYGDTFHAYNWADKPHRVLYGAIDLMRNSASTLESLQRENENLRKNKDHISAEKAGIAKNAHNNVDYWKSQAEAAEAEVKRYRVALIAAKTRMRNCRGAIESDQVIDKDVRGSLQNGIRDIQDALASTGGEHHGN